MLCYGDFTAERFYRGVTVENHVRCSGYHTSDGKNDYSLILKIKCNLMAVC